MMQSLDDEPLVEPAYATAPTFGARAETVRTADTVRAEPVRAPEPDYQPQPRHVAPEPVYEEPAYVAPAPVVEEPRRRPSRSRRSGRMSMSST